MAGKVKVSQIRELHAYLGSVLADYDARNATGEAATTDEDRVREVAEPGAQDSAMPSRGKPNGLKYIPPGGGMLEEIPGFDRLRRNGGK